MRNTQLGSDVIKQFILDRFLPGEDPERLGASTPLVTSGLLDSLSITELVGHLESEYGIEIAAHEIGVANFDSLELIGEFLRSKR